jgi:hypothetical protein
VNRSRIITSDFQRHEIVSTRKMVFSLSFSTVAASHTIPRMGGLAFGGGGCGTTKGSGGRRRQGDQYILISSWQASLKERNGSGNPSVIECVIPEKVVFCLAYVSIMLRNALSASSMTLAEDSTRI